MLAAQASVAKPPKAIAIKYDPKSPEVDFKRLQREAAAGLPVKVRARLASPSYAGVMTACRTANQP